MPEYVYNLPKKSLFELAIDTRLRPSKKKEGGKEAR